MSWDDLRRYLPDGKSRILGIVGDPIGHSLSPAIQTAVLRYLDRNLIYLPFAVTKERLRLFVKEAGRFGIRGLNVTTPYKEPVWAWVTPADPETRRTRMVNTIDFGRGRVVGLGTDGAGVQDWLETQGLLDGPIGLLGFGPTARSVVHSLWRRGKAPGRVVTRRPSDARRSLREWPRIDRGRPGSRLHGPAPVVVDWSQLEGADRSTQKDEWPKVWVSTLPPAAGPLPREFWSLLSRHACLLDMNYGSGRARVAREARDRGWRSADGLGPLLYQAARSLSVWIGEPVPVRLFLRAAGVPASRLRPRRR